MDSLAKPWIVVRDGQIIHSDDSRICAYAVAREAGAMVYWCDEVRSNMAVLSPITAFNEDREEVNL